jgi:rubredoxin
MKPVCVVCGHVHDEATEGKWENLADDFTCPECGCGKEDYEMLVDESERRDNLHKLLIEVL